MTSSSTPPPVRLPSRTPRPGSSLAAGRDLQEAGARAGVRRIVSVSIIGAYRFSGGYGAAKIAHEQATLAGPVPARVVRAAQFHEFVEELIGWGLQGDVSHLPEMRTQLVAAHTVAVVLADVATANGADRERERERPLDPDHDVYTSGGLLPGPRAILAGPTSPSGSRRAPPSRRDGAPNPCQRVAKTDPCLSPSLTWPLLP